MRRLRFFGIGTLSLAGFACGGQTTTTDTTAQGAVKGCDTLAHAACEHLDRCDPIGAWLGRNYGSYSFVDRDACEARFRLACENVQKASGVDVTEAKLSACATRLDTAACGTLDTHASGWLPFCDFGRGTSPVGAKCLDDAQCASGRCQSSASACGTCAPVAAPGAPCAALGCPADERCDGVCKPAPKEGQACGGNLFCPPPLQCVAGLCKGEGVKSVCDAPLCAGRPDVVASGGCGATQGPSEPSKYCVGGSSCVGQNDFGSGQCKPIAQDGAACHPWNGPTCLFPATCVGAIGDAPGTCVVAPPGCP